MTRQTFALAAMAAVATATITIALAQTQAPSFPYVKVGQRTEEFAARGAAPAAR